MPWAWQESGYMKLIPPECFYLWLGLYSRLAGVVLQNRMGMAGDAWADPRGAAFDH